MACGKCSNNKLVVHSQNNNPFQVHFDHNTKHYIGFAGEDGEMCCSIGLGTFKTRMHAKRVCIAYNKAKGK